MNDENPFRAPQQESLAPARWPLWCLTSLVVSVVTAVLVSPIVVPGILVAELINLPGDWWLGRITSWREARAEVLKSLMLVLVYPVADSYAECVRAYAHRTPKREEET